MRVLVDEDCWSRELLSGLRQALGNGNVVTLASGTPDSTVWDFAQRNGLAVLTANVRDFRPLAAGAETHAGLLLVVRFNDPRRDLRAGEIVTRLAAFAGRNAGASSMEVFVNSLES